MSRSTHGLVDRVVPPVADRHLGVASGREGGHRLDVVLGVGLGGCGARPLPMSLGSISRLARNRSGCSDRARSVISPGQPDETDGDTVAVHLAQGHGHGVDVLVDLAGIVLEHVGDRAWPWWRSRRRAAGASGSRSACPPWHSGSRSCRSTAPISVGMATVPAPVVCVSARRRSGGRRHGTGGRPVRADRLRLRGNRAPVGPRADTPAPTREDRLMASTT